MHDLPRQTRLAVANLCPRHLVILAAHRVDDTLRAVGVDEHLTHGSLTMADRAGGDVGQLVQAGRHVGVAAEEPVGAVDVVWLEARVGADRAGLRQRAGGYQ
jgi:hypothetical protein